MILHKLVNLDTIATTITERSWRDTKTKRVGKDAYPIANFRYSNYNIDPKPQVLLLGRYTPKNTGNELLAGINLNYMSKQQITQLRDSLKQIFSRGGLRSRYRYIKRKLPDIAQFYRTYDEDEIHALEPDQLTTYSPKRARREREIEPEPDDEQMKAQADVKKLEKLALEPPEAPGEIEEPEVTDAAADSGREAWQMQQRLYDPVTGRRQRPEQKPKFGDEPTVANTRRAKHNRYRQKRRELKKLERQAEIDRISSRLDRERELDALQDVYDDPDYALTRMKSRPRQSEIDDPYESVETRDFTYSPQYGFTWASPQAYMAWHSPPKFREIMEFCEGPVLAVHDTISGKTIVDAVPDHSYILNDVGWDYDHTVLFEISGSDLVAKYDDDIIEDVTDSFLSSDAGQLLIECCQNM